jgi:signal transduction histidine kinase
MIDLGRSDRRTPTAGQILSGDGDETARALIHWAESFLENAPAAVTIIRHDGYRLLYANAAFRRLHSIPPNSRELSVSDLLDPVAARELEAMVDRGVAARAIAHDGIVTTGAGALHCSVWPLAVKTGVECSMVMIEMRPATDADADRAFQVDVTQRLVLSALHDQMIAEQAGAAEKVAAMANAAKARFLTTMSHELRTPLNAIGGYAELIEMGLRGPVTSAQRDDLARIQHAQEHLLGLINSVLNFAKLEAGSVQFDLTAVALEGVLEAVHEMLLPHVSRQGLVYRDWINKPPTARSLQVHADPEKLRQILINLLTNAIKFTAPGGTITAWYDIRDEVIAVHISDTGRGIPQDQLATVFDPFVQVGRRLSSGDQGVGLGLSISRDLARGMGGDLTVTSTIGVGSTFTLTLNRASRDAPPSP